MVPAPKRRVTLSKYFPVKKPKSNPHGRRDLDQDKDPDSVDLNKANRRPQKTPSCFQLNNKEAADECHKMYAEFLKKSDRLEDKDILEKVKTVYFEYQKELAIKQGIQPLYADYQDMENKFEAAKNEIENDFDTG